MKSKLSSFGHMPLLMKKQRIYRVDNSLPLYSRYWITKSHKFASVESPRQLETFSIGKGDIMMRIYDKILELRHSASKQATFADSWGVEKYDEQPVARVEFQLRREILKNQPLWPSRSAQRSNGKECVAGGDSASG